MLCLTQHLYDPGTLPSSAIQRDHEDVYLRSSLPRKQRVFGSMLPYSLPGLEHAATKVADKNNDACIWQHYHVRLADKAGYDLLLTCDWRLAVATVHELTCMHLAVFDRHIAGKAVHEA